MPDPHTAVAIILISLGVIGLVTLAALTWAWRADNKNLKIEDRSYLPSDRLDNKVTLQELKMVLNVYGLRAYNTIMLDDKVIITFNPGFLDVERIRVGHAIEAIIKARELASIDEKISDSEIARYESLPILKAKIND